MSARERLADENPDALWPDGFDDAFIGLARRCGQPLLAAFSMKKAIVILMSQGMSDVEALEFFEFNVVGAWSGPGTPVWIDDIEEDWVLGPEDLPSGQENPCPAPSTPMDTPGEILPGTDGSTADFIEPDASISSAPDDGTRSPL